MTAKTPEELRKRMAAAAFARINKSFEVILWDDLDHGSREVWLQALDAALSAADSAGWQLVPKELTEEMYDAATRLCLHNCTHGSVFNEVWAAALSTSLKATP